MDRRLRWDRLSDLFSEFVADAIEESSEERHELTSEEHAIIYQACLTGIGACAEGILSRRARNSIGHGSQVETDQVLDYDGLFWRFRRVGSPRWEPGKFSSRVEAVDAARSAISEGFHE